VKLARVMPRKFETVALPAGFKFLEIFQKVGSEMP
jgi:hypothetical protein